MLNATGALRPAEANPYESSYTITPLVNRNGWVNPEDLAPMPQCIAQQDQSAWLSAMTRCTSRQCTRHFGVICTHHQWLTQLTCLSTEFSPDVVSRYLPFCSRSVLAKAQLFQWIHTITGRTWLVNVGDAKELQSLSPVSLTRGYAAVEVTEKAPTCLTESYADPSMEPFQHVMASCGFTSDTQHTGNAARPWEYRESPRSMVALDSETAGYDLTQRRIAYGDYFDKHCFCETFRTNRQAESCQGQGLASTKERLWLNATCGPKFLPTDWTNGLQTTTFTYIATKDWRWPDCVASLPQRMIRLADHCTADACGFDADGYCKVERAVDRARFCRGVSYEDCKGPCQVFGARISYVNWLHDVCGEVKGWHGLPKHWRQLAAPTSVEIMPWRWTVKASRKSGVKDSALCASTDSKLGSIVLINLATLLAALYAQTGASGVRTLAERYPAGLRLWFVSGLAIAALHLFPNWINAALVQATAEYETVSVIQLMLLWSAMPRLTWLSILIVILHPSNRTTLHTIASCLVAETVLQALSAFPMIQTINYGREHNFYSGGMARLDAAPPAQYMYAGAAMWLLIVVVSLVLLLQIAREAATQPELQTGSRTAPPVMGDSTAQLNERSTWSEEPLARHLVDRKSNAESEPLLHSEAQTYGTLLPKGADNRRTQRRTVRLTILTTGGMFLLWIAQWLFWAGFIGLSAEGYVLMRVPVVSILT